MSNTTKEPNDIRPVFIAYPTLYSLLMLNYLIYRKGIKFAGIILSVSHIKTKGVTFNLVESFYILIRRSGIPYALYMSLQMKCSYFILAAWQIAARLAGKKITFRTFGGIVKKENISCLKTIHINSSRVVEFMKSVDANIIVSGYNNQILKYSTCKKLRHRAINIHNSYLPDFGGLDASFEVLYAGVKESGATIHFMDKGIDTGKIIKQKRVAVDEGDTVFSLNIRQWLEGARMLPGVLDAFKNGNVEAKVQDPSQAKYPYRSFPEQKRVDEFLKGRKRLIRLSEIFVPQDYIYELFDNSKNAKGKNKR